MNYAKNLALDMYTPTLKSVKSLVLPEICIRQVPYFYSLFYYLPATLFVWLSPSRKVQSFLIIFLVLYGFEENLDTTYMVLTTTDCMIMIFEMFI